MRYMIAITVTATLAACGSNPCDSDNILNQGLSPQQLDSCDECGMPTECPDDSGDDDGPFACVSQGVDYDLCMNVGALVTSHKQHVIDAWEGRGLTVSFSGTCDEATRYLGLSWYLNTGPEMMFVCNSGDGTYNNDDGSIVLVPGIPLGPVVGATHSENDQLPIRWASDDMKSVPPAYESGIMCGADGFWCLGDMFWCACACVTDDDCSNTFGVDSEAWVCESGQCMSLPRTAGANGGPGVYGLARWGDGIALDGTAVVITPAMAVRAVIDHALWEDDQLFDLSTGEILWCGANSLCSHLGLSAGDVVVVDPSEIMRIGGGGTALVEVEREGVPVTWSLTVESGR